MAAIADHQEPSAQLETIRKDLAELKSKFDQFYARYDAEVKHLATHAHVEQAKVYVLSAIGGATVILVGCLVAGYLNMEGGMKAATISTARLEGRLDETIKALESNVQQNNRMFEGVRVEVRDATRIANETKGQVGQMSEILRRTAPR